jgi:hypothetical protein
LERNKFYRALKCIIAIVVALAMIISIPILIYNKIGSLTWINFFGSYMGAVIGGFITLCGVLLTLSFTRKQISEEKRLALIPYLKPSITQLFDHTHTINDNKIFCNNYFVDNVAKFLIELENLGTGNAIDVYIEKIDKVENFEINKYFIKTNEKKEYYCEVEYDCLYNEPQIVYENLFYRKAISLWINYKDLIGNAYRQEVILSLSKSKGYKGCMLNLENFNKPELIKK